MKNKKFIELAIKAGFFPWEDEPWRPSDTIDWSSRYDNELEKFGELVLKEALEKMGKSASIEEIKEHFNVT